ncbi:MAG: hypothetical protein JST84_15105 [Acidobacteria bacterium]|nr:hypothetical protein [Acidobacteriota bacterium]
MASQPVNAKKCPRCKLINPETALRCDCGYDFFSGRVKASYITDPKFLQEVAAQKSDKQRQRVGFTLLGLMIGFFGLVILSISIIGGIVTILAGAGIVFLATRSAVRENKFEGDERIEPGKPGQGPMHGEWLKPSGDYAFEFGKQMMSIIVMLVTVVIVAAVRVFFREYVSTDLFLFLAIVAGLAFLTWWVVKKINNPRE